MRGGGGANAARGRLQRVGLGEQHAAIDGNEHVGTLQPCGGGGAPLEHARDRERRAEGERGDAHRGGRREEARPSQHEVRDDARTDHGRLLQRRPVLEEVRVVGVRRLCALLWDWWGHPALCELGRVEVPGEADEAADRQQSEHVPDRPARRLGLKDRRPETNGELTDTHTLQPCCGEVPSLVNDDNRAELAEHEANTGSVDLQISGSQV